MKIRAMTFLLTAAAVAGAGYPWYRALTILGLRDEPNGEMPIEIAFALWIFAGILCASLACRLAIGVLARNGTFGRQATSVETAYQAPSASADPAFQRDMWGLAKALPAARPKARPTRPEIVPTPDQADALVPSLVAGLGWIVLALSVDRFAPASELPGPAAELRLASGVVLAVLFSLALTLAFRPTHFGHVEEKSPTAPPWHHRLQIAQLLTVIAACAFVAIQGPLASFVALGHSLAGVPAIALAFMLCVAVPAGALIGIFVFIPMVLLCELAFVRLDRPATRKFFALHDPREFFRAIDWRARLVAGTVGLLVPYFIIDDRWFQVSSTGDFARLAWIWTLSGFFWGAVTLFVMALLTGAIKMSLEPHGENRDDDMLGYGTRDLPARNESPPSPSESEDGGSSEGGSAGDSGGGGGGGGGGS